ncbi:S-layer protein SlpA [Clostridioides sp. ES-S-0005-03]|uniref:S-layer protein SlpA n=1 Tax=Clostridioides sp. ES-S-0005-03 TaxID=2770774 RepID=UPI001D124D90|nr:S-layer protein SlpA [Clostridioides sp. ES-S-0005-03]UDN46748.1 S-layer protein SlpA [Clostridioides sp. ES-S-0173-01]
MNKKNLAMAMAAVTVVGSAAPVFAADAPVKYENTYTVVQSKYEKALKDMQKGITDKKIKSIAISYEGKPVTTITVASMDTTGTTSTKEELASALLKTTVNDKLDNLGDGDYVDFDITYVGAADTLTAGDLNDFKAALAADTTLKIPVATTALFGAVTLGTGDTKLDPASGTVNVATAIEATISGNTLTVGKKAADTTKIGKEDAENTTATDVTFKDGAKISVSVGDPKIDLSKSFTFDDTTGKLDGIVEKENTATSHAYVRVINAKEQTIDLDASSYKSAEDLAKSYAFKTDELKTLYTEIEAYQKDSNATTDKVQIVDGKYQTILYAEGKRLTTKSANQASKLADENSPLKLVIKADKLKDLKDYVEDLRNANNGYSNTVTVAGDDRIETAIELSRKYYNNTDEEKAVKDVPVDSVVLVGSQAIVDGLVASPLASEKEAPLLLTSKDKLDSNVKSEIKRVMNLKTSTGINNSKKVYLAGGVNSISKEVENELKDMGLKVTRLAGDDRYATSLEIADEIGLDNDKAFVVGGTGLADAMSIAPVASQLDGKNATPIVVVDGKAKELSSAAEDFLDDAQVDIIGGKNSVSKEMEDAIDDATGKSPNRISGDDRQATNAEVLKESDYFPDGAVNYFVAKDGSTKEDQLVDALAAAPVAASFKAPIILATDSLSSDQNVAISKALPSGKSGDNLIQVGQGIASSVITKIKDLLDM